ncbi:unnamed protein product [Mucor fragilis]
MEIDDEALDQSKLHTYSYLLLTSDSDTVSVKSVDYSTVDAKDSQEYNTADEKNYLYEELYGDDDASEASSAINKSNAYTEESLIEDMSIDGERFLETKENASPTEQAYTTNAVKRDHPRHKRLYQK